MKRFRSWQPKGLDNVEGAARAAKEEPKRIRFRVPPWRTTGVTSSCASTRPDAERVSLTTALARLRAALPYLSV